MAYNIIDILDKVIDIEYKRKEILKNAIDNESENILSMNLILKVLFRSVDHRVNYYKFLKERLKEIEIEDIDFMSYDKISFLINEHNRIIYDTKVYDSKELLNFALELAGNKLSLLVDIQGRFVNNSNKKESTTYEILSKLILSIRDQINKIEESLEYI